MLTWESSFLNHILNKQYTNKYEHFFGINLTACKLLTVNRFLVHYKSRKSTNKHPPQQKIKTVNTAPQQNNRTKIEANQKLQK